jgi:spermidine/putrescine transport system substrate-binding protein
MAWQSGITGVAYNPALTGRAVTSLGDLFSGEFAGHVGMFGDAVDMPNLAMVAAGIDPETSTPEDWDTAAALLRRQREDGIVRGYFLQNYLQALRDGRVAVAMGWSGDIAQANGAGGTPLAFSVPDEGGLLWTDAMAIPAHAANPAGAIRLMDHVYRPDVAALIAAAVAYVPPVDAARERVFGMAARAEDPDEALALRRVAESPLVFPDEEDLARLSTYRELENDEELARWDAAFGEFYR